tara:strand:- start:60119 stop:61744 length:1626 start_codon:yes stop_codon:yes gene_type:complete
MYVKKTPLLYHILVLVLLVFFSACATPIAPTGGIRDTEGPKLLETTPKSGTTNFRGNLFEFQFSEYVSRTSVPNSITVEPDLGLDYSLKWKKKKLIIEFKDDLPDSTTIILTLGAEISDTRNNKIGKPITLAISTGDEIDEGDVTGRIRKADTGESFEGGKVLLYRAPIDLTKKATYQAETDTGGVFQFSYLREGRYQAIFVDDRNRNKIWDKSNESAQVFSKNFIELTKAGQDTLDVLYVVQIDTLSPKLQGVGMFSSNRLRLRFNENIKIENDSEITILDSLGNAFSGAYPLYISKKDPFVLFGEIDSALSETILYTLSINGITDNSGNDVITSGVVFEGSSQSDTTLQRVIAHETKNGLFPYQSLEVTYAAPIFDAMILDSVVVVEGDVSFDDWPAIRTVRNKLFIDPQGQWIEGIDYQFLVWNPATQRRQIFNPEIWSNTDLGELNIEVRGADSSDVFNYTLENESISFSLDSVFTNSTLLQELAPITYILTVFKDENNNGKWDIGSVSPYKEPEPYYIQRGITIQRGFTSEIIIQF